MGMVALTLLASGLAFAFGFVVAFAIGFIAGEDAAMSEKEERGEVCHE